VYKIPENLKVGNYYILQVPENLSHEISEKSMFEWEEDYSNPTIFNLKSGKGPAFSSQVIGLVSEGIYYFKLTIDHKIESDTY